MPQEIWIKTTQTSYCQIWLTYFIIPGWCLAPIIINLIFWLIEILYLPNCFYIFNLSFFLIESYFFSSIFIIQLLYKYELTDIYFIPLIIIWYYHYLFCCLSYFSLAIRMFLLFSFTFCSAGSHSFWKNSGFLVPQGILTFCIFSKTSLESCTTLSCPVYF